MPLRRASACIAIVVATAYVTSPRAIRSSPGRDAEGLVFVTEDLMYPGPGCDAISVLHVETDEPLYRGATHSSPGRLAVTNDISMALTTPTNYDSAIYVLDQPTADRTDWRMGVLTGVPVATAGGVAMLPDGETFLVASARVNGTSSELWNRPPFGIRKYKLPHYDKGRPVLDEAEGSFALPAVAAEIVVTSDGRTAHAVTTDDRVVSLDVVSMTRSAMDVDLPAFEVPSAATPDGRVRFMHATLSRDERYLVTNGGRGSFLRIVDLVARRAWRVDLSSDVRFTGGVAINRGWINADLLAVHAETMVLVYDVSLPDRFREVGRFGIRPPRLLVPRSNVAGPYFSVAWSASGGTLIAATDEGQAEFVAVLVGSRGADLSPGGLWTVCDHGMNAPNDIWTANGLYWPTPTATPRPSPARSATLTPTDPPTRTPPATATATRTATPTPMTTATATPTASAKPTSVPVPLFLPLALRERCPVEKQHVDVALVIDVSTSMRDDRTAAGRTKLEAAIEAATAFVGALGLPLDQAAVVGFNSAAWIEQTLTAHRADVEAALARIPDGVREQTRIDLGIAEAHQELLGPRRLPGNRPVMIVLTDGLANPEPASTAVRRAAEAKADEITIFTIGLGDEGALNVPELTQIASRPEYFHHAPHAEDLAAIYRAIAVELPCPGVRLWPGARPTTTAERLRP